MSKPTSRQRKANRQAHARKVSAANRAAATSPVGLRQVDADLRTVRHARPVPDGSQLPSTAVYRTPGEMQHKGAEVAKMLATGQWRTQRKGGGDAAGPLRESVGCTTQRGGVLDYLERTTERSHDVGNAPAGIATRRAAQIDDYRTRATAWDNA